MKEQTFYFITVFAKYDEFGPHTMRCWGFFDNYKDAYDTLHFNTTDLWETIYDYGVIEEYNMGICNYNFNRWFFKYNQFSNEYREIKEPTELKHYCGFAL